MATTYSPRVPMHVATDAAITEADAASEALEAAHGRDYKLFPAARCRCGRSFSTTNGLGLHNGAVKRQASKLWDDTYTASLERAGY